MHKVLDFSLLGRACIEGPGNSIIPATRDHVFPVSALLPEEIWQVKQLKATLYKTAR